MNPPTPTQRVHAHRVRRSTIVVASALILGGLPFVASALEPETSESTAPASSAPAVPVPAISAPIASEPLERARRALTVPDLGSEAEVEATGPAVATRVAPPTPEEVALAAALAVLADSYQWDERSARVEALQQVLGVSVDGRYGHATHNAHRAALVAAGFPTDALPIPLLPPGPSAAQWEALRQCESGGDYSITNPSGKYRGAYQFDRPTWNSVAGRHFPHLVGVDPAAASRADQDAMALALYGDRSHRPWPQCGRHLR
jgi:hypothetical protein